MKAFAIDRYGNNDQVREVVVADPDVRPGDVMVEVRAASVNPLDSRIRDGKLKTVLPYRLPLILGNDLAGVVVAVGPASGGSSPATRSTPVRTAAGSAPSPN